MLEFLEIYVVENGREVSLSTLFKMIYILCVFFIVHFSFCEQFVTA